VPEWTTCPTCGLKHTRRPDGTCPRCRRPLESDEAAPPAQPPPLPPVPPSAPRVTSTAPAPYTAPRKPSVDFGEGLAFFFRDPRWISKLLILSLIFFPLGCLCLIGMPFVEGYQFRLTRRVVQGDDTVLPEWDDLGGIFVDGLRMLVVRFGAPWPLLILVFVAFGINGAVNGDRDPTTAQGYLAQIFMVVSFYGSLFLSALYLPAVRARMAVTNDIGTAFQMGENFAFIRRNAGPYFLAFLLGIVARMIANFGLIIFCVGIIPTLLWAACVQSWAEGQLARIDGELTGHSTVDVFS
jgi:hypothetical protein